MTIKELYDNSKNNLEFLTQVNDNIYDINNFERDAFIRECIYCIGNHRNITNELIDNIKTYTSLFVEEE